MYLTLGCGVTVISVCTHHIWISRESFRINRGFLRSNNYQNQTFIIVMKSRVEFDLSIQAFDYDFHVNLHVSCWMRVGRTDF